MTKRSLKPTDDATRAPRRPPTRAAGWLVAAALLAAGCAVNPVTGERELGLVSPAQEIQIGTEQYVASQQMQGGAYRLEAGLTEYVQGVGQRLVAVSDRDLPYEFAVLNNSVPNAWALPGGKIAVNRGLLVELGSEAELAAVLGHEIVHAAARHGARAMERGMLLQGALLATAVATSGSDYGRAVVGGAQLGAQLVTQRYGREAEREADYYGMVYMDRAGYDPQAAVDLQQTFVRLSEGRESGWFAGLFASHPPSPERVENNRRTAAELGAGGEMGAARYRAAIATLREHRDAYEAADAAREALGRDEPAAALEKVERALAEVPGEARFHALRGDVRRAQGRLDDALVNYDRALARDDGYFAHWLARGVTRLELGREDAARTDLERSVELLPTATALNALGRLALDAGENERARRYLSAAAQSDTASGVEARRALARLELPEAPDRYLGVRWALGDDGRLLIEIANEAPIDVRDVAVALALRIGERTAERTFRADGVIEAGTRRVFATGIGPFDATAPPAVQARIVGAEPAG